MSTKMTMELCYLLKYEVLQTSAFNISTCTLVEWHKWSSRIFQKDFHRSETYKERIYGKDKRFAKRCYTHSASLYKSYCQRNGKRDFENKKLINWKIKIKEESKS